MKDKIKAALQQAYPHLGLDDETFDGVAAAAGTVVKEEADIPNFVSGAEAMLKRYQSIADKARGEAAAARRELEELKAAKPAPEPSPEPGPKPEPDVDYAKLVAEAVTAAVRPLQEQIDAFRNAENAKGAIREGKEKFFATRIVPEYAGERDDAWDRALEYNELKGNKMTGDELAARAKEYFDKSVSRKGVDSKRAYEGSGSPKPAYDADRKVVERMRGKDGGKK